MVKSKFRFTAYIVPIFTLAVLLTLVYQIANNFEGFTSVEGGIFVSILLSLSLIMLFSDMYTKGIAIELHEDNIRIRHFIGLLRQKKIIVKDLDGFQTSIINSRGGNYNILYLIRKNKKIVKISEFYHSNYNEMQGFCSQNLKDLGFVRTNLITEVKDIFNN